MIARIHRKKYKIYAFDIETHNDEESLFKKETSMWLGCLIDEESKVEDENIYYYNMISVLNEFQNLTSPKRSKYKNDKKPIKNICIYIYNLSFEWSFILPVLLNNFNFKFKEKIEDEDEFVFNTISTKSVSSVWQCQLKFGKNSGICLLRDLSKIFGGGLGKVAKSFNIPTQKGSIDYRLNRLHNYKITQEEKEYCFNDTRIIIEILMKLENDKTFWNSASMATYAMQELIKSGYPKELKPFKKFRLDYPILEEEETNFLRKGVGGGLCYANKLWQFKDIKHKILHIDAHQMHPTQAYIHFFPYGYGTYFTGKPKNTFTKINCIRIKVSYSGVKLHSIIELIGIDFVDDYTLTIWDFELPTMYKCYIDLEVEFIDGYEYNTKKLPFRNFYKNNYLKRLEAKQNKDEYNVLRYKLLNNSSYGKLLEKPHNSVFINTIKEDGIIDSEVIEKDILNQKTNAKYTYLPVGSCIPAYSRVMLVETALLFGYKKIIYFDTDSIFCIYDEETKRIWESDLINKSDFLGGWALEEIAERAQFTAPKRYKLLSDNKTIIKAGGINFEDDLLYDEINIINSSWNVKRVFRCKGGTLIDFQVKEMKVQPKYEQVYLTNTNDDLSEF